MSDALRLVIVTLLIAAWMVAAGLVVGVSVGMVRDAWRRKE